MKKIREHFRKKKEQPLPFVHLPHHHAIKKTQQRWLLAFLIFFAFAAFYSFQYSKAEAERNALVSVIVANQNLSAPGALTEENLAVIQLPSKDLPEGVYLDSTEVLGKAFIRNLVKNQIILPHDIHFESDPESISAHFEELFAFSIDESWLSSRLPKVRKNDKIDVVVSNPKNAYEQSKTVAQQIKVLDIQVGKDKKKTLIVNITKEEAEAILFSQGLRLPMQVLVYPSAVSENPLENAVEEGLNEE